MLSQSLDRALKFQRDSVVLLGGQETEIDEGVVVRTPSLPHVWSANHVRVTRPVTLERAVALVEEHLGDADFRHLVVESQEAGSRLEDSFRALGWRVDRELLLALARPGAREVDTSTVLDADPEEWLALYGRWVAEDETHQLAPGELETIVGFAREVGRVREARWLGARDDSGALVGITTLYSDRVVAQVEDVYVAPEARRRGHARAMVTRAVELAREATHELIFIVADDNDWPKQLYQEVGFAPIGKCWLFHKKALSAPGSLG